MKPGSSDGILTVFASILVAAVLFVAQHFTSAPRAQIESLPEDSLADASSSESSESSPLEWERTSSPIGTGDSSQLPDPFDQPFATTTAAAPPNRLPSVPSSTDRRSSPSSNSPVRTDSRRQTRTFETSASNGLPTGARSDGRTGSSSKDTVESYKVISIIDGDTVDLLVDRKPLRLRLNGIDTPEKGQPFGNTAKDALSKAIGGQEVQYLVRDTDRYGRSIADVYFRGVHINKWLVQKGLAWHYKAYNDDAELARAEQEASAANRGLWADRRRVAPWNWRKLSKLERDQYR